jgi:hypothetical protein
MDGIQFAVTVTKELQDLLRSDLTSGDCQNEKTKLAISKNRSFTVVGTSCKYEKQYYRLGSVSLQLKKIQEECT